MCVIKRLYKKGLLIRYDKDGIIPYLSNLDFEGLKKEEFSFKNSKEAEIACFSYFYDGFRQDKVVVFCHGLGAGHTGYMAEINELCKNGFKVITLDYMGCDKSEGDSLPSINEPTRDIIELLDYLKLKEEVVLVGHSLGGYSVLNVMSRRKDITCAVVMSGFISVEKELAVLVKLPLFARSLTKYEKKLEPVYTDELIMDYLKNTTDHILFIHSKDDQMVPYETSTAIVEGLNNPNFDFLIVEGKKHNPKKSMNILG